MELYILRHGIAEEAKAGMKDADRALTPEGKEKLKAVLRRARAAGVKPDMILTSPFRRAVETAKIAAEALGYGEELLKAKALIPGANPKDVWDDVRVHKDAGQLLLAGHEPLLSQTIGYLLGVPSLQVDLKKGALARIDLDRFGAQPQGVLHWLLTPKLAIDSL